MKRLLRLWAKIFISATPKTLDVPMKKLKGILIARLLTIIIPSTIMLGYMFLIKFLPSLIHVFAIILLFVLIPMFIIGMWRLHNLGVYFKRKYNAPE